MAGVARGVASFISAKSPMSVSQTLQPTTWAVCIIVRVLGFRVWGLGFRAYGLGLGLVRV